MIKPGTFSTNILLAKALRRFVHLTNPESLGCLSKILHTSCGLVVKTSILGVFQIHRPPSVGSIELISWGLKSISAYSFQLVCGWMILFINSSRIKTLDRQPTLDRLLRHIMKASINYPAWCPTSFSTLHFDIWIQTSRGWEGSVPSKRSGNGGYPSALV